MADTEQLGALVWYELMTPNPDAARPFYDAVVGWKIDAHNTVPGGGDADYRMISREDGGFAGGVLALRPQMIDGGATPGWFAYVYVPDVDAAVTKIENEGGKSWLVQDTPGVGRMALVSDPWGATFYVMKPIPPAGDPDATSTVFSPTDPQHVRWHDLWTGDQKAAARFYADLFGWRTEGAMPMGDGRYYEFLHNRYGLFGGLGTALPDGSGPRLAIYIGVDDIDRAMAAVTDAGGELTGAPNPVPGGDIAVHARDPQGASFGLVGPRKDN